MHQLGKFLQIIETHQEHYLNTPSLLKNEPTLTLTKSEKSHIPKRFHLQGAQILIVGVKIHTLKVTSIMLLTSAHEV